MNNLKDLTNMFLVFALDEAKACYDNEGVDKCN